MIGQTTSHYPILDELGEGGVWLLCRPPDTRLKEVPDHLSLLTQQHASTTILARSAPTPWSDANPA
jgi:hypothetical protein